MVGRRLAKSTQYGHGGFPVFEGSYMQRGSGLGQIFSGLMRSAIPLLKTGVKGLGREALRTGIAVGQDILNGRNMKTATKRRLAQSAKLVAKKSLQKLGNSKKSAKAATASKPKRKAGKRGIKRKTSVRTLSSTGVKRTKRSPDIFD